MQKVKQQQKITIYIFYLNLIMEISLFYPHLALPALYFSTAAEVFQKLLNVLFNEKLGIKSG